MKFAHDGEVSPAGTQYLGLIDALIDLFNEKGISDVEVVFISYKLDNKGEKVVEDKQHVAQIIPIGITGIGPETRQALRKQYDSAPLLSLMVLWLRPAIGTEGRLGVLGFRPVIPGQPLPLQKDHEPFEKQAISFYLKRNCPDRPA